MGSWVTLREGSGALERWQGHDEASGRRRHNCCGAEKRLVSVDRAKQRGREQTRGCLALMAMRWSSPRQRMRQKLYGGHGTNSGPRRSSMGVRGARERCEGVF
jgi:hypothetical protein